MSAARPEPLWIVAAAAPEHRACVIAAVERAGSRVCLICEAPGEIGILFPNIVPGLVLATKACLGHAVGSRHEIAERAHDAIVFANMPAPEAA